MSLSNKVIVKIIKKIISKKYFHPAVQALQVNFISQITYYSIELTMSEGDKAFILKYDKISLSNKVIVEINEK